MSINSKEILKYISRLEALDKELTDDLFKVRKNIQDLKSQEELLESLENEIKAELDQIKE